MLIFPDFTKEFHLNAGASDIQMGGAVSQVFQQLIKSIAFFYCKVISVLLQYTTEELYFLFPLVEDQTDTQVFEVLLNHSDSLSLDRLNLTLAALSFDDIAKCESSSVSSRALWLTDQTIFASPVIAEILECNYRDGYSYATIKLVLEQFTDALIKNNSQVNILYSEEDKSSSKFYWTNIFSSLESRQNFVESWQAIEISKEKQGLLL